MVRATERLVRARRLPTSSWEIYAELHATAVATAVPVRTYVVGRSFNQVGAGIMALYDLGQVVLTTPRQRTLVGRLTFDAAGRDFNAEGPPAR